MGRHLCAITAFCLLACCQGLDLTLTQETPTVAGTREPCGVLTCVDTMNTSVPSTPDRVQAGSGIDFTSIASMAVFKRISTSSGVSAKDKREVLIGSVTPQAPSLTSVSNGRKVDGLLEAGRATVRVELVKQVDCRAEFSCQVRGLDNQGREVVSSASLVQQPGQKGKHIDGGSLMPVASHQLLTTLQQMITQSMDGLKESIGDKVMSLEDNIKQLEKNFNDSSNSSENRFEDKILQLQGHVSDKIEQVQKSLNDRSNSFERRLRDQLDNLENRVEDKIDNNNNLNQIIQLDFKVSRQLAQFCTDAKADILDSLDAMRIILQGEQTESLNNVSKDIQATLNNATNQMSVIERDLDLLKSYGERNMISLRNNTHAMKEMLLSGEITSRCLVNDTNELNDDLTKPSSKVQPQVCERGMGDHVTKSYHPYVTMTHKTTQKQILCDTQTDGGGWIVIQRRAKGDVDFYKDWAAYREGFGSVSGDFWMGNEAIHKLTYEYPYELRIDFRIDGQEKFAQYSSFRLDNEALKYRLNLGSYSGTVGETSYQGLSYSNLYLFTTFDRDNDAHPSNCAINNHGAWWYGNCHNSNLNGMWAERSPKGMSWSTGSGWRYPTFTEMKIRRVQSTTSG